MVLAPLQRVRHPRPRLTPLDIFPNPPIIPPVGVAAKFIKIDAEVHRVRLALKANPDNKALQKELNGLIKARETLLLEVQRQARNKPTS